MIRRVTRNFFGSLCQAYYEKKWLEHAHFQLVVEAMVRELVPQELLDAQDPGKVERWIWESHDFSYEEKRFIPHLWDLVRPFIDTQKTFRKTFAALEQGRLNALNGPDEGQARFPAASVGTERAATFLRTWIRGTLDVFTIEHGDPLALLEEEKMVEVFACLLNTLNDQGASVGLPQRWTCEALPPPEGWRGLVQELLGAAVVSCRVRLQEGDGKASGKGGKAAPSSAPAAFAPKGSQDELGAWD
eukprot:g8075.t1